MKRFIACIMMIVLMCPVFASAAPSPELQDLQSCRHDPYVYNTKDHSFLTVYHGANGRLKTGTDYVITKITRNGKVVKSIKTSGNYVVTIQGIGKYRGEQQVSFIVKKRSSNLKVKVAKKTYKKKNMSKKKTFRIGAKSRTKKSYTVLGSKAKKYIKVSKGGKVTVKKNIPKGTYKIRVTSRETLNHKKTTKVVKIRIK